MRQKKIVIAAVVLVAVVVVAAMSLRDSTPPHLQDCNNAMMHPSHANEYKYVEGDLYRFGSNNQKWNKMTEARALVCSHAMKQANINRE